MELIKPHHKPSERVTRKNLARAYAEAKALATFLEEGNKAGFTGNCKSAVAISHCQVSEEPLAMFAISSELVAKSQKHTRQQNGKNFYFPAQVIFNAEVIEAMDEVERLVPKREMKRKPNSHEYEAILTREYKFVTNLIDVPDACMSYPDRTKKNTSRYHTIKVRYQIMRSLFGFKYLKTVTEEVEALKAHIFQHEIDHAYGMDMYFGYGDRNDRKPEKPYKNIGSTKPVNATKQ